MSRPEFVPDPDTAVAVTGLACRFPGAPDAEAFWTMLVEGREGLVRCTDEELAERGVPRRLRRDPAYVPVAGLIDGQDMFDPKPFGLAAAEAALLDPQHRLFLECAWRALEQAGHGEGPGPDRWGCSPAPRRAPTWRATWPIAGMRPVAGPTRPGACRRRSPRRPTTCRSKRPTG